MNNMLDAIRAVGVVLWPEYGCKPTDHEKATADIFDGLAERGRFDEEGGELSDEDWADSQ